MFQDRFKDVQVKSILAPVLKEDIFEEVNDFLVFWQRRSSFKGVDVLFRSKCLGEASLCANMAWNNLFCFPNIWSQFPDEWPRVMVDANWLTPHEWNGIISAKSQKKTASTEVGGTMEVSGCFLQRHSSNSLSNLEWNQWGLQIACFFSTTLQDSRPTGSSRLSDGSGNPCCWQRQMCFRQTRLEASCKRSKAGGRVKAPRRRAKALRLCPMRWLKHHITATEKRHWDQWKIKLWRLASDESGNSSILFVV